MLTYLHVRNIALIEELEIDFNQGLNILTGETGAGKSIIIGSIQYVLGGKFKKDFIRTGASEASVDCIFDAKDIYKENPDLLDYLASQGVARDEITLLISRKTAHNGRSVFRINGDVVRQQVVLSLAETLIDIHSQREHQSVLNASKQRDLLDRFVGESLLSVRQDYEVIYRDYQTLLSSMDVDILDDEKRRREISFLEFEIAEIQEANLLLGEDMKIQNQFDYLSQRKELLDILSGLQMNLFDSPDFSAIVSRYSGLLNKYSESDTAINNIQESLFQLEDLLKDVNHGILSIVDDEVNESETLDTLEKRLDEINRLKSKYGDTLEEIFSYQEKKQEELDTLLHFEENLAKSRRRKKEFEDKLTELGNQLSSLRIEGARNLGDSITDALHALNLEHATFQILVSPQKTMMPSGFDQITFMISTNKGEEVKPLVEVASGGEISRVMLAVKSILAKVDGISTMIFDEIDTGISGVTAQKVAERMHQLAKERQLICITHLPQIAAMADTHYRIRKEILNDTTLTMMDRLTEEESTKELARMLSGATMTKTAEANAKEMKKYAKNL